MSLALKYRKATVTRSSQKTRLEARRSGSPRRMPRQRSGRRAPSRYGAYAARKVPLLPVAVPALARARNFPSLALALGLVLAAVLLDQGFGDEPQDDAKDLPKDWARANADATEGADIPVGWPVGTWNPAPVEGGYISLIGDIYELVLNYETGGSDWVLRTPGYTHEGEIAVSNGINVTVERLPVGSDGGWVDVYYNTSKTGFKRLFGRVFGGVNLETRNLKVGIRHSPGPYPVEPFPLPPGERRTVPRTIPEPADAPAPASPPRVEPARAPSPLVAPVPFPLPLPSPVPGGVPLAPSPRPLPAPARMPALLPRPLPVPVRETLTDGQLAPLPAPAPLSTPTWQETPWPSGPVIGAPSSRPQATPEGIVRELGRLEQKMAAIGGAGGLDLAAIVEALQNLLPDPPNYEFPPGSYSLEPVCEVTSQGVPLPARVVSWAGGSGELAEIRARLDAIAELFQVSKELRQPICKGPPRSGPSQAGQPVTVTFEEVV